MQSNLHREINRHLSEPVIEKLAYQIGEETVVTRQATDNAINLLLAGLSKNTSVEEEAMLLQKALERDHKGDVLADVLGTVLGNSPLNNEKARNGGAILQHIFKGKEERAAEVISSSSGLDKSAALDLMIKLAPVIMGVLGKRLREKNLHGRELHQDIENSMQEETSPSDYRLIKDFLNQEEDGSILDEILRLGRNLFNR